MLPELESRKLELDAQFFKLHGEVSEQTTELQSQKETAISELNKSSAIVSENENRLKVSINKRQLGEKDRKKYEEDMAEIEQYYQQYWAKLEEHLKSAEDHQN